jgi:hypothetical protein
MRRTALAFLPAPAWLRSEFAEIHTWPVPAGVRRDRDAVVSQPLPERYDDLLSLKWVKNPPGRLITEFCGLAEASEESIVAFAQEYGLLGYCKPHHMPAGHDDKCGEEPAWQEPFADWRLAARNLGALLRLGLDLSRRGRGAPEDWEIVFGADWKQRLDKDDQLAFLAAFDVMMRRWGRVRPILTMNRGHFSWLLCGPGYSTMLAAALAHQAAAYLLGARTILLCSGCTKPFRSERFRNPERRAFCPTCGEAAAQRAASRDYYRRKAKARAAARKELSAKS